MATLSYVGAPTMTVYGPGDRLPTPLVLMYGGPPAALTWEDGGMEMPSGHGVLSAMVTRTSPRLEHLQVLARDGIGQEQTWQDGEIAAGSYGAYLCESCFDRMTDWSVPAAASPTGAEMAICRRCVVALGYTEGPPAGGHQRTFVPRATPSGT
jgi:hypothetical protein